MSPVVFVSGPWNDLVKASALELMSRNFAVICVHPWVEYSTLMGYGVGCFESLAEVLIERCDAVLFVPGWECNEASLKDMDSAERFERQIFFTIDDIVEAWSHV